VENIRCYDNNPFACAVAEKNVTLNDCDQQIQVKEADLRAKLPDTSVDLVVANLYKELLLEFFENPDFWKAKYYLISGFIPSMEEELLAALPMDKLKLLERRKSDTWRLWLLAKK
jgi:ribosomal protein L11 methyltransferase